MAESFQRACGRVRARQAAAFGPLPAEENRFVICPRGRTTQGGPMAAIGSERKEETTMKCFRIILAIAGAVAALAATVTAVCAVFAFLEHKRDDEELERYLDCSIQ